MKELSIEEKARAYDKVLAIAKEQLNGAKVFDYDNEQVAHDIRTTVYNIFPELKESEDDEIRESIAGFLKTISSLKDGQTVSNEDFDTKVILEWVAWLEKQGEQKSDINYFLSWSKIDEKMLQSLESIVKDYWAKAEKEKNEVKIREASDVSYFLKTIQKSPLCWIKCSDGLPNRDGVYLVVTDGLYNEVYDLARYDSVEGWHKASEIIYWMPIPQLNDKTIIGQKPTWSEEDELMLKDAIEFIETGWSDKGKSHLVYWLKSLKQRIGE